jgi:hypothetical protein
MCLTYQWALINSMLNFTSYFIFIRPHLEHHHSEVGSTLIMLNNTLPAIILMFDFFINCVPFIMRHCIFYLFIEVLIIMDLFYENRTLFASLDEIDYSEDKQGVTVPIVQMIISILLYYIFTHLYKLKLRLFQKEDALEQLYFIFDQLKQVKAIKKISQA